MKGMGHKSMGKKRGSITYSTDQENNAIKIILLLEIVITRAAPTFHKLFMVMGCVFDTNSVYKTVEKLSMKLIRSTGKGTF